MSRLVSKIMYLLKNRYVITIDDLAENTEKSKKLIANILHYLYKRGAIRRIYRGIYTLQELLRDPLVISTAIYYPSYISFGTALSLQNVVDQVVNTIEVATSNSFPKTRKKIRINKTQIVFYRLPPTLMFGYRYRESRIIKGYYYYLAKPEKAILDYVHKIGDPNKIFTINWDRLNKILVMLLSASINF